MVSLLEDEGAEAVVPDLYGFVLYSLYNVIQKEKYLGWSKIAAFKCKLGIEVMELYRKSLRKALDKSKRFEAPERIEKLR